MSMEGFIRIPKYTAYHLLHPRPAVIVVSLDSNGKPNGMTAAWTTPVSMNPPLITVSIAPRRYTYKLIKETGDFTVNVLDANLVAEAHLFGTCSGRRVDKFAESKLTAEKSLKVKSPHIKEALAVLECNLYREIELGDHILVVGEVLEAYVKPGIMKRGIYDPKIAKVLMHLGGVGYITVADEIINP